MADLAKKAVLPEKRKIKNHRWEERNRLPKKEARGIASWNCPLAAIVLKVKIKTRHFFWKPQETPRLQQFIF